MISNLTENRKCKACSVKYNVARRQSEKLGTFVNGWEILEVVGKNTSGATQYLCRCPKCGYLSIHTIGNLKGMHGNVSDGVKDAVRKSAKAVKAEISANAPAKTGRYKGSWSTQKTKESADDLEITVYSKKPGLPHLLEHGHALRGGGRTRAIVHIAPAEQKGIQMLEQEIEKAVSHG